MFLDGTGSVLRGGEQIVKELLLLAFAAFTGFLGGVMYTRDVYRPLVDWMNRTMKGGERRDS